MESRRAVGVIALASIGLAAIIHLSLGMAWLVDGSAGNLAILFIVSAIAIGGGIYATYTGMIAPTVGYALGGVIMVIYLVGYVDYHALNFTESLLGVDTGHDHHHNGHHDHHHGEGTVEIVIDHLRDDPLALVSKISEIIGLASVLVLLGIEQTEP